MATTDILLLKPVASLGGEGELLTVKAGYARNYLIPRALAVPATQANRRQIEELKRRRAEREANELSGAEALATRIGGLRIALAVQTGEGGKMFGAVTAADLLAKLEENGISLERKQLHLAAPVKTLGEHTVEVRLHHQVKARLTFEVVSENPIIEAKED